LLFEQSVSGQAFYAALDNGEIFLSRPTFVELAEVLGRKKFDRYLTRDEREQFLAILLREATVVEVTEEVRVCRDPKDDKFLELAVSGGASCLVTGDQDLLVLHPFRGVPVLVGSRQQGWRLIERCRPDPLHPFVGLGNLECPFIPPVYPPADLRSLP
jgi:putative PIN family toxin of toxin-antitoxin system